MANLRPVPKPVRPVADRFATSLVAWRGRWTVGVVLLLGAALFLASRLGIRSATADFLPRGAAVSGPGFQGALPSDPVVVVLESPGPLSAANIGAALDTLAIRLGRIPAVGRVEHRVPADVRRFLAEEFPHHLLAYYTPVELDTLAAHLSREFMERALLGVGAPIPRTRMALAMGVEQTDPLGVIDPALRRLREIMGSSRIKVVDGYLSVPDQRSFFLLLEPQPRLASLESAQHLVRSVEAVLDEVRAIAPLEPALEGTRLYLAGRAVAMVAGTAIAVADLQRVAAAVIIAVFLVLTLALRRILAPILIVGTVLCGLVLTAALATLLVGSLNVVSWAFIAALIGFGDEFAIYIISHYWMASAPEATKAEAIAAAIRRPGPGILLGGLTTAAAFIALGVIRYPVMKELAWFSSLGMLLILIATFSFLPLALVWTNPGRDARPVWRATLSVSPAGHRWPVLVGWSGFVLVSLLAARNLVVDLHPWRLAVRGVPQSADLAQLSTRLGASIAPFLLVSRGSTEDEALANERLTVGALEAVRAEAGVAAIVALSRWLPPRTDQEAAIAAVTRHGAELSAARFVRDFRAVVAQAPSVDSSLVGTYLPTIARYLDVDREPITLALLRTSGFGPIVDRHLVRDGDGFLAIAQVYPADIPWAPGVVERFQAALGSGDPILARAEFVGEALQGATHTDVLRRDFLLATALALVLTLAVLAIRFRRWWPVLLCLVPVGCGLCGMFGLMAVLHLEVNLVSLVGVTVILGLGSDDGIHVVDRFARGEMLDDVLRETAAPMIITTLTTIAGFACLGLAKFPGVAVMGIVASFGLLVCLVASLTLVPTLHRWRPANLAPPGA